MITQYRFSLHHPETQPIRFSDSYRLYAWLLTHIPEELADEYHETNLTPISQYLCREDRQDVWTLTLLDDRATDALAPVLKDLTEIQLNSMTLGVELIGTKQLPDICELKNDPAEGSDRTRTTVTFASPTAFRQDDRYVIVPDEKLILHSMIRAWNIYFPSVPLDDEDAVRMLENGIHVADYSLHTTRFHMKGKRIPGYVGDVTFEVRLSEPLMELWRMLLAFSTYTGIGVKTTLGMGGIRIGNDYVAAPSSRG